LYARLPGTVRERWMGPMAITACGLVMITAVRPGLAASVLILAAAEASGSYQVTANTAFMQRVPEYRRAQAFSIAATGLVAGQGAGFAIAGWAAQFTAPTTVTATAGALGAIGACVLALSWRRLLDNGKTPGKHRMHLPGRHRFSAVSQ
jgi:hypothetical protein